MNHLEGGLIFAGIPLAVFVIVVVLVFTLSSKPESDRSGDDKPS